jgi:hypothetical protein
MHHIVGIEKPCIVIIQKMYCEKSTKLDKNRMELTCTTIQKNINPEFRTGNTVEFQKTSLPEF